MVRTVPGFRRARRAAVTVNATGTVRCWYLAYPWR